MNLIEVKLFLQKHALGRFFLKCYRKLLSLPILYLKAIGFYLIETRIVQPSFYNDDEVFELIRSGRKSFARFGDGEISWIYGDANGHFGQVNDRDMGQRLVKVLKSRTENLIIGIPNFFDSMQGYNWKRRLSRNGHMFSNYKRWNALVDSGYIYGDALLSRVYNGRTDKYVIENTFNSWLMVWRDRDVVIVEGEHTKFGVGNKLLENTNSVRRIIAPAENAFEHILWIKSAVEEVYSSDVLFLICLGPTATILAHDISIDGYQAVDIGHLDIEYEWYITSAKGKRAVRGKYVNEVGGQPLNHLASPLLDDYDQQIVSRYQ